MVITFYGLQYLVCDNSLEEETLKFNNSKRMAEEDLDSGYIAITQYELEELVNVDQDNLALFYGKQYKHFCDSGIFPYIEVNGKVLFYSNVWCECATKVRTNGKLDNVKGIYYYPDELETSLYATDSVELFILLDSQPIIPFYCTGRTWANERGIRYLDIVIPNNDISKEFKGYTRKLRLCVNDKLFSTPIKLEIA